MKAPWIAWPAGLLAVVFFVGAYVATVLGLDLGEDVDATGAAWTLSWIGFPLVGALIASRRSRHPVGWLLLGVGIGVAVALAGNTYAYEGMVARPGTLPAPGLALWLSQAAFIAALALVPFVILLFPSGRVDSRRMRRLAIVGGASFGLLLLAYAVRGVLELGAGRRVENPFAIHAIGPIVEAVIPPLFGAALAFTFVAIGHAVWRLRRADDLERRQLKWFAYAAALFPVLMGIGVAASGLHQAVADIVVSAAFLLSLNGMAAAIGIAILRHGLYDIDRIVSRTVSYAILTAVLVGVYGGIVVGAGSIFSGSDLLVAGGTLAAAALFRPLRGRIQALVDRRFNRSRYDAERILETFAGRLRDEVDLDTLGRDLRAVVASTVAPASVSLWIPGPTT